MYVNDPELLTDLSKRLVKREENSFSQLVEISLDQVVRQARLLLGQGPDIDDAVQEIYLRAMHALQSFRGGNPLAWIGKIAHNYCLDVIRKRTKTREIPVEQIDTSFAKTERTGDESQALLNELTSIEREVLLLRIVEGLGYQEISQITGLAEGTLRNTISRVMQRLRQGLLKPVLKDDVKKNSQNES